MKERISCASVSTFWSMPAPLPPPLMTRTAFCRSSLHSFPPALVSRQH